ncbi:CocE/NonD family hydrolase [Streptomyces chattanoogensis]|uniref:CocE/NonD family hydrolase n=1 Tax=Streptomyces chattanoogensis TaxID=66876 RepID=UPI0036C481F7
MSQLVAAHDERVSAVVAMSTWGDLREALYENSTRHIAAMNALPNAPKTTRFSERTEKAVADLLAGENTAETLEWARRRSPLTCVERLNDRSVPAPVYFAHTWHETLFPPNQTLEMFNALSGPKRMALSIGDHGSPEISGLLGLPNRIWVAPHALVGRQSALGGPTSRPRTGPRSVRGWR